MSDKKNKLKRARISSEESDSSSMNSSATSSSDDETDAKDLKPIKEYMTNRKELASQLFKSVKAEKIRMMLPQILKKCEFNDLEELCANELIGMSKARIMCIINGQDMIQSSNTEDSDDLGPSLEIISDTEWLSTEEVNIKEEGVNVKNKNTKKLRKKVQDQRKQDLQSKLKTKGKEKLSVKVKMEAKEKEKQKEGESLLDLLELEMRARAIRALIRKEEDSSNSKNDSTKVIIESGTSNNKNTKARHENLKEQLEKIDVLMKHGEDEDVFVVIQSAPTIELLSSESETEDHTERVNQKLVNERISEIKKIQEEQSIKIKDTDINKENNKTNEKHFNVDKDKNERNAKIENSNDNDDANKNSIRLINIIGNDTSSKIDNLNTIKNIDLEEGEIVDDNENEKVAEEGTKITNESLCQRKFKKIKKNPSIRSRKKNKESNDNDDEVNKIPATENERSKSECVNNLNRNEKPFLMDLTEIEESLKRKHSEEKIVEVTDVKIDLFDDKSLDIDEVINLDDYPDDMDELEKGDINKETNDTNKFINLTNKNTEKGTINNVFSRSETWATRYYKQDDVQNVIKESKIQSEIRKRLRERQRQSKMNNLPKVKDEGILQQNSEPAILKPTGSVEEYHALKGISNEMNNYNSEITEALLPKRSNLSLGSNRSVKAENYLIEGDIEMINNLLKNDSNPTEESNEIVEKIVLIGDTTSDNIAESASSENLALQQLNKITKCNNFFEELKAHSSAKLEQNELSNNNEIICPSIIREINDKSFVKVDSILLDGNILKEDSNDKQISEKNIRLSKSKTSELRPD